MVSRDLIFSELQATQDNLTKWIARVNEGIPGLDLPASTEEALVAFYDEFSSELYINSGRLENLARALRGEW